MMKITIAFLVVLFALAFGGKIPHVPEQDIEERTVAGTLAVFAGAIGATDKAVDVVAKANEVIQSCDKHRDHAIIINLTNKKGIWYVYNSNSLCKWYTRTKVTMGPHGTITVATSGNGPMTGWLDNRGDPEQMARGYIYTWDGRTFNSVGEIPKNGELPILEMSKTKTKPYQGARNKPECFSHACASLKHDWANPYEFDMWEEEVKKSATVYPRQCYWYPN